MANEQNLIPNSMRSPDEVRENGRKGGIKSGEVRRKMAMLKKELEMLLNKTPTGEKETYKAKITAALILNAIDKTKGGNHEAYKTIAKLLGEFEDTNVESTPPSLNINIVSKDKELEKALYEED